jgi:hypothetical protein
MSREHNEKIKEWRQGKKESGTAEISNGSF